MAEIIHLENRPAQSFPIRLGDVEWDFLFSYNQMFDRWSYSIFPNGRDECPLDAGHIIAADDDLVEGLGTGFRILVVNLPGVSRETLDLSWFYRMTQTLGGDPERAGTYLLKISLDEIEQARAGFPDFPFPRC